MPGILDLGEQYINELRLTKKYGKEIEGLSAAERKAAINLLPELEKCVDLGALQQFNEKMRQWIDRHPRP